MNNLKELKSLISMIYLPNQTKCFKLLNDNLSRFKQSPGSLSKHQAWKGGYIDHLNETMKIAIRMYEIYRHQRPHSFSLSDVLVVLFLHDLEKPFKYIEPKIEFHSDHEKETFINELIDKYGIELNDEQKNALKYIHGEGKDFSTTERIQSPLAAFCHICDTISARIWFDYPKK